MYKTLQSYEAGTQSQRAFYGQALSRLDEVVSERKDTLAAVKEPSRPFSRCSFSSLRASSSSPRCSL
jgi:hypothetical protein